ncbi:lasso peptide biosynthesis B2 protein [Gaopeijia maritima]|uniref:Lasso peptide biosynthesis B2 protein n=1 Tax=Gaopeijia maritima TaxID=3119007 RepID=A0ABU9E8W9_9BACT
MPPVSPRALVRKLRRLGGRGALDLIDAQRALLRARRALRTRPRGDLLRAVPDRADPSAATTPADFHRLDRIAVSVRRASDYGLFRPTCLVRAIALEDLAHRHGILRSVVRVGVRRRGGAFEAHAWLELEGRVVGDTAEHVADFTVLDDFSSLTG